MIRPPMRVLIVGAGSVGQVYGWYLQKGGAEVWVHVRDKYADEARAGFVLYPPGVTTPVRFVPSGITMTPEQIGAQTWDQVWLCVPSTALLGPGIPAIAAQIGGAALVSMLPGLRDREVLTAMCRPENLVIGLITFSSWHAPLTTEPLPEPGMAWWNPPLTPNLFEGPRAAEPVAALKAGGAPAAKGAATQSAAMGSSFLTAVVAAMEVGGWTFAGLRTSENAGMATRAGREALTISAAHLGIGKGPFGMLMSPMMIGLATRVVPFVAPMDFEAFLRVHFSKVGDQTALALDVWITEGTKRGLPVAALTELREALRKIRGRQ